MVVIEMNPRVSRSSALASKATGFPIAKAAAQSGRRLHARRDRQRHHEGNAGVLRAVHRLLRGEGAALRVREVPGHRRYAFHPHEGRGRGHGHRPHVRRGAWQGACVRWRTDARAWTPTARVQSLRDPFRRGRLCDDLVGRPTAERIFYLAEALRRGMERSTRCTKPTGIDPWFIGRMR